MNTPTKVLECIRDKDGPHSNAASYEASFVQALAKEIIEERADNERLRAQIEELIETGTGAEKAANLCSSQLIQADADVRMWKGNYEAAEQHVTILTKQLAENEAKWKATFEKRVAREEELLNDTIQETVNDVLAKLNANGVDTSDCDGDEDVVTILAHWIQAGIETAEAATEARAQTSVWAADALNCRQAIRALLKFHPESPETGAELPPEAWTEDYRRAVTYAKRCLLAGGGGAEQAGDENRGTNEGEAPNDLSSATGAERKGES